MKRALAALLGLLVVFGCIGAPLARADAPEIHASAAYLMEAASGRVLYQQNAGARLPMASTTKIMTALLAIEQGDLDALVRVPDEAYGVEGSSMYLNRGETLLLRDLIYGLMLLSGNDAAVAIACHIAGSQQAFAEEMNRRAASLGLTDTHFVTPNGLHDDLHYTSAEDLARIAAAAMQNEAFRKIVSTTYHETTSGDRQRTIKSKNRLLWQYDGGCGVKTGFTKAAGKCLVFAAERDGMLLIGALLNCPDMWDASFALLDYGFDAYALRKMIDPTLPVGIIRITGGTKKTLEVYPKHAILYAVRQEDAEEVTFSVSLPDSVAAPIQPGQTLGTLTLYLDGEERASAELIAAEGVPAADTGYYIRLLMRAFIS